MESVPPFRVACVQNCADDNLARNLDESIAMVREARSAGAELICLPEYFCCIEREERLVVEHSRAEAEHPAVSTFASLARELGAWILLGSIPVRFDARRVNNRSLLIDAAGGIVARYDKIHLFDAAFKGGERYRESSTVARGDNPVLAQTPWGLLGMTVCYDLRFPQLYRTLAQRGAAFLSVPSAFTRTTGRAHWHVLLRARAIETGSYVFAPAQFGMRPWGRATYGHSLIVDPWGEVLADGGDSGGHIIAEIDPRRVLEVRAMIPSLEDDWATRPDSSVAKTRP
jgi:predicted amidohydrolase